MLETIRKRRSIRTYLSKPVEPEKIDEVLKAAMFAPTARNLRAWDFVVVTDPTMKKALALATPYAKFAAGAPLVIAVCFDPTSGKRFKEDSSIAAAHVYLEASNQGLGTCYIQVSDAEGEHGDAEAYVKKLLHVPDPYRIHCLMPLGYPAKNPPPHTDEEFEPGKIHWESW